MLIDTTTLPENALQAITAEELQQNTELFNIVKQLRLRLTNVTSEMLDKAYKQHVQNVFSQLDKKLDNLKYESSKQAEIVMARHGLCDASMQQIVFLCESISPALGSAISQIRGMHSSYFAELQSMEENCRRQLEEKDLYCEEAKREVEAIDSECSELMEATSLLDAEAAKNTTLILTLRRELRESNAEIARLKSLIDPETLRSANVSVSGADSHSSPISTTKMNSMRITTEIGSPKRMDTTLPRNVRGQVTFDTIKSPLKQTVNLKSSTKLNTSMRKIGGNSQNCFANDSTRYMDSTLSRKAAWTASPSSEPVKSIVNADVATNVPPTKTVFGSSSAWLMDFRGELQKKMDGNIREITLKECKSLMQQFYESKENQVSAKVLAESDGENKRRNHVPSTLQDIETMEIHVYRSMEKKYGLRSLAVEHAAMFLDGLKRYSYDHIDVEVFYKIFCNEIEEGFVKVQQELEKSIKDLFILQIMNKHANKDQESLNSIIEERLKGVLADHEYMDIVNYLYNEKDATQLRIILGVECQEANDKREEEQVNPRRHFEYKNDNITDENDMKRKLGYVSSSLKGKSQPRIKGQGNQKSKEPKPNLPPDYFDITYKTFVRLCLKFQLNNHEKYLRNFRAAFLRRDSDNDGILTSEEFRICFMSLRSGDIDSSPDELTEPSEDERNMFQSLLQLVDPNDTDRITFSNAADRLNSIGQRSSASRKVKDKLANPKTKPGRIL